MAPDLAQTQNVSAVPTVYSIMLQYENEINLFRVFCTVLLQGVSEKTLHKPKKFGTSFSETTRLFTVLMANKMAEKDNKEEILKVTELKIIIKPTS